MTDFGKLGAASQASGLDERLRNIRVLVEDAWFAGKAIDLVRQVGPDSIKAAFGDEVVILSRAEADFVRSEMERLMQE